MFPTQRKLWAVAVLVILAVGAPTLLLAHHSWGSYHWARTSNPFTLKMGDNVDANWQTYFDQAISDWTQSTVLNTVAVAGSANPKNCRPTAGRVEVCNARYGYTGWLDVAQIWISGGHIAQGTVKLNDSYYSPGSKYDTPAWRAMVACQEIGHTFGLDHQDETFDNPNLGTCMDYTNNPAGGNGQLANTDPNQGDYDQLLCIYDPNSNGKTLSTTTHSCVGTGHLDTTTTVGQTTNMPNAMANEFGSPAQWGRMVAGSEHGGGATYDLDFGNGNHVFTFVIWAR